MYNVKKKTMEKVMKNVPKIFTSEKEAEAAMKNERELIYVDHKLIETQEKAITERLPYLNKIYKAYLLMDIGKPSVDDLGLIVSLCDERHPNLKINLRDYFVKKASKLSEVLELGKRKITLAKAIETGLYELPGFDEIYLAGTTCRNHLNKYADSGFTYRLVEIVNDEVVINQKEFDKFKEKCHVYLTTEKQKETYKLFKKIIDSVSELKSKGLITEHTQVVYPTFFINDNGKLIPNHNRIIN